MNNVITPDDNNFDMNIYPPTTIDMNTMIPDDSMDSTPFDMNTMVPDDSMDDAITFDMNAMVPDDSMDDAITFDMNTMVPDDSMDNNSIKLKLEQIRDQINNLINSFNINKYGA